MQAKRVSILRYTHTQCTLFLSCTVHIYTCTVGITKTSRFRSVEWDCPFPFISSSLSTHISPIPCPFRLFFGLANSDMEAYRVVKPS